MPEFYGYAVALELKEHQEARRLTAHGTLYRALDRLQRRGLVQSRPEDPAVAEKEQRPRRRLYHVTAEGEAALRVAEASQDAGHSPLRPRGSDL
jgi:DNA-binding PadR family transcriptional regulator